MEEATKELKKMNVNLAEIESEQDIADVGVSVNGSWSHAGFSASFCVVYAVSVDIGKVIDYVNKYRICRECALWTGKEETEEYKLWYIGHEKKCTRNHEGSAQSMEAAGMVDLWMNSITKRGLRYTTFVGDGDSKGYNNVVKTKPYGPDVLIVKENCV